MTEVDRLFQMASTAELKARPPYAVLVRGAWSRGRVDERNVIVIDVLTSLDITATMLNETNALPLRHATTIAWYTLQEDFPSMDVIHSPSDLVGTRGPVSEQQDCGITSHMKVVKINRTSQ